MSATTNLTEQLPTSLSHLSRQQKLDLKAALEVFSRGQSEQLSAQFKSGLSSNSETARILAIPFSTRETQKYSLARKPPQKSTAEWAETASCAARELFCQLDLIVRRF
jgi:hypothetical protein